MNRLSKQMLDGNVETMLMAVLEAGPSYGYALVKELNARAAGLLKLGEGTVYPVLHRMEEKGLVAAKWRKAENGRERKYYHLSPAGKTALARNRSQWDQLASAMGRILELRGVPELRSNEGGES